MVASWEGDHRAWGKRQKRWTQPRLQRLVRPMIIAICTTLLLLLWYYGTFTHPVEAYTDQPDNNAPNKPPAKQYEMLGLHTLEDFVSKSKKGRLVEDDEVKTTHGDNAYEDAASDGTVDAIAFQQQWEQTAEDNVEQLLNTDQHSSGTSAEGEDDLDDHLVADAEMEEHQQSDLNTKKQQPHELGEAGPKEAGPNLDPETEMGAKISSDELPKEQKQLETESVEHLSLEEKAGALPDIIHRPLEESVKAMKLQGWEDEWVASATFNRRRWGTLEEPKIDFVYLWVNGSDEAFQKTKRPYELNSILNDADGTWINSHGLNRYRDWDELRYSLRSIEKHAKTFRNKVQILVNPVDGTESGKQVPSWLNDVQDTKSVVEVLSQEDFFDIAKHVCLPTFNSLTIENQIFNTPSDTDQLFALSDDMLLGKRHAASDIYSPLFGPVMGFKANTYSTTSPPTEVDAHRFGEKPFLIYTSWLLNRRFGIRKRKGQGHFGHSLSRSVTREAIGSFPGPELQSACKRFRGEPGFQLYSWYVTFHYTIERHREALLWSYIMLRSDQDGDGNLSWNERQVIMDDLATGMKTEGKTSFRKRNFYHVPQLLERAGLQPPNVNTDVQWTSLDGPVTIQGINCLEFDVNECLAPGFSISSSDEKSQNPVFSSALIFDRVARQNPKCGDCLIKLILNKVPKGLGPLLPHPNQEKERELVIKAIMRYRYSIINPDALFVMVTDAEQVDSTLVGRYIRGRKQLAGQLCLNDDVSTTDDKELADVQQVMTELYQGLFPEKSPFEK